MALGCFSLKGDLCFNVFFSYSTGILWFFLNFLSMCSLSIPVRLQNAVLNIRSITRHYPPIRLLFIRAITHVCIQSELMHYIRSSLEPYVG